MIEHIKLTEKALIQSVALKQAQATGAPLDLRLYLDGKGCDGFYYGVSFDERSPQDHVFTQENQIDIIVDPETIKYVAGSIIDWVDDERGRGFLVENPHHRKFRGKFFKSKTWLDRLAAQNLPNVQNESTGPSQQVSEI
jgi:iron-sulfur cluster assembly accessory protein